jgi:hypothetical protein
MDYDALDRVLALLRREKRLAYRVLRRRLQLDDKTLEDLEDDLSYAKHLAMDEDAKVLSLGWGAPKGPLEFTPTALFYSRGSLTACGYSRSNLLGSRCLTTGVNRLRRVSGKHSVANIAEPRRLGHIGRSVPVDYGRDRSSLTGSVSVSQNSRQNPGSIVGLKRDHA